MTADGSPLAMAILACTALGFVLWKALWPRSSGGLAPYLAMAALALSFLASSLETPPASLFGGAPIWRDELARVMRGVFLGMMGLSICVDYAGWEAQGGRRERQSLALLASCGGALAISAADLGLLWVGIELYTLSALFPWLRGRISRNTATARALGSVCLLFGCSLLYASAGTLDMRTLNLFLWERGGPRPAALYSGLGLVTAGIALATGLFPPYGELRLGDAVNSPILGAALLARLYLFGAGALAWECFWITVLLSLLALAWGCLQSLRTRNGGARAWALSISQRGFLLMALALMLSERGFQGFLTGVLGYALAQGLAGAGLDWVRLGGRDGSLEGLARHTPALGVPLAVGLLSLSGIPLTIGFRGRAEALRTAFEQGHTWLAVLGLLVSLFCAWVFLPLVASLLRDRAPLGDEIEVPARVTVALYLVAFILVLLGVFAVPLESLAASVGGA